MASVPGRDRLDQLFKTGAFNPQNVVFADELVDRDTGVSCVLSEDVFLLGHAHQLVGLDNCDNIIHKSTSMCCRRYSSVCAVKSYRGKGPSSGAEVEAFVGAAWMRPYNPLGAFRSKYRASAHHSKYNPLIGSKPHRANGINMHLAARLTARASR